MADALVLMDQVYRISERYRIEIKVYEVVPSIKYPQAIKARFVLVDLVQGVPRLLVDNHEPYGFHVHDGLPGNKNARRRLVTKNYMEAEDEFWRLVQEILDEKN